MMPVIRSAILSSFKQKMKNEVILRTYGKLLHVRLEWKWKLCNVKSTVWNINEANMLTHLSVENYETFHSRDPLFWVTVTPQFPVSIYLCRTRNACWIFIFICCWVIFCYWKIISYTNFMGIITKVNTSS